VLGFAELLKERPASEVVRLLSMMRRIFAAGGRIHRTRSDDIVKIFKSFNFSDLIVRATRLEPGANLKDIVDWELYYLSENQLSLALEGILIRGAICIGDLVTESQDSLVFGPALVKCYTLESQYAVYPRIVIDRELVWRADEENYIAYLQDYYTQGEDGAYFVDYLFTTSLTNIELGPLGDEAESERRVQQHSEMITKFIDTHIRSEGVGINERIKQKWMWLALYHNSAILRLQKRLQNSTQVKNLGHYLIPEEKLKF
jgi:hypothetical protein